MPNRFMYYQDIPEVKELLDFVSELDIKYNVESGTGNSFGRVFHESVIHVPDNLLTGLYCLNGCSSNVYNIPTHDKEDKELCLQAIDILKLLELRTKAREYLINVLPKLPSVSSGLSNSPKKRTRDRKLDDEGFANSKYTFTFGRPNLSVSYVPSTDRVNAHLSITASDITDEFCTKWWRYSMYSLTKEEYEELRKDLKLL